MKNIESDAGLTCTVVFPVRVAEDIVRHAKTLDLPVDFFVKYCTLLGLNSPTLKYTLDNKEEWLREQVKETARHVPF